MTDDTSQGRDTSRDGPVPHARHRIDPIVDAIRRQLASSTLVERVAWHTGEAVHKRPSTGRNHPEPVDMRGQYDGEVIPEYPVGADRAPERFVPAGDINPVLTAADVTDFGRTDCVADPFLFVTADGDWHMFFEVYTQNRQPSAVIGHAESANGYDWRYDQIVLEADEHLSYPYVFKWEGAHYMVPDTWAKERGPAAITLYKAGAFPYEWEPVSELVRPATPIHDFSPFRWEGRWWALAGDGTDLYAYYSDDLEAPNWTPHEANPVVRDRPTAARPGGRPLVFSDHVLAFYQDSSNRYGERVHAYEITELTPETYTDSRRADSPVLDPTGGLGWNSGAIHQVDPWFDGNGYLCAVDGNVGIGYQMVGIHHWAIGIYRA